MRSNARMLAKASPFTRKSRDTHKHKPKMSPNAPVIWRNGQPYQVFKGHVVAIDVRDIPQEKDMTGCAKVGERWNRCDHPKLYEEI